MNAELFALLTRDLEGISLAALGRAIASARRCDRVHIRRVFLRPRGIDAAPGEITQRIRVRRFRPAAREVVTA